MVDVHLWSGLRRMTDGQTVVTVEARTLRQMLDGLVQSHPALAPVIRSGVSVSVDGEIETNLSAPLRPEAEVWLIQRIKGG